MSNNKHIGTRVYRGVLIIDVNGSHNYIYTDTYSTPGKAKAIVTIWSKNYHSPHKILDSWVETPTDWKRVT